jgi:RNA recognition motif-containing protein
MATTLFVDGLPSTFTRERLEALFQPYGVTRVIMGSHRSGRCLGFGFVEFSSAEQAGRAMEALHGRELQGGRIRVCTTICPEPRADVA